MAISTRKPEKKKAAAKTKPARKIGASAKRARKQEKSPPNRQDGGTEKKATTWVAPPGYELCTEGACGMPQNGGEVPGTGRTRWTCSTSIDCKGDCKCYVCLIAPGEKHLRVEAEAGATGTNRAIPPGWTLVCACLKKKPGDEPGGNGWGEREDVGWIAPPGYKFATPCPGRCQVPSLDPADGGWVCGSKHGDDSHCQLVGVIPGEKQLHYLSGGGRPYPTQNVPPGWAIFCICLNPPP